MADSALSGFIDPQDYAQAMRSAQLANVLQSDALTAPTVQQPTGGKYFQAARVPWLAGASKLAEALMAQKAYKSSTDAQTKYAQALMGMGNGFLSTATGQSGNPTDYGTRIQALNRAVQFGLVDPKVGEQIGSQIAAENKPPELDSALRGAGIMPNTPEYQNVMAAAAKKGVYIPPGEVKAGNIAIDANNKPIMQNPQREFVPDPFHPGQGHWNTAPAVAGVPLPGQASGPPQPPMSPTPPGPPAPNAAPSGGPALPAPAAPKTYFPQQPRQPSTAGDLEEQKEGAKSGSVYASELAKNATGATEVRRSLSELNNLFNQATPSASNAAKMKLGSYMMAAGMDPQRVSQFLGVDVGALQAAQKQTATLAVNTIHSMTSRGTNFDLDTFMQNNPNLNMSDPSAFRRVVQYMDNKAAQEVAKQADFSQWKKGHAPEDWETDHTAHWLAKQNQDIDSGKSNSQVPAAAPKFNRQVGSKTYYSMDGKRWFDNPSLQ